MRLSIILPLLSALAVDGLKLNSGDPNFIQGYPKKPAWGWDKAKPKTSLSDPNALGPDLPPDQAHTAKQLNLNLVQLVHWTPIVPAFLMAKAVYFNSGKWDALLDGDKSRSLLMLLSPIIAFFGGLPGIMMHTYEGWQVAPFKNPLQDPNFKVADYNNQWLRIVAYQFIFVMQYVGLITFAVGILGYELFNNRFAGVAILLFFVGYVGNQFPKLNLQLFQHNTLPLSWYTIVAFAVGIVFNILAFAKLGEHVFPDLGLKPRLIKSLLPPILIGLGGGIEGLLAETRFNQWIHFFAVVLFNAGFILELGIYNLV
jgi:hypothetical protein